MSWGAIAAIYVAVVVLLIVIHWRIRCSHAVLARALIDRMDSVVAIYTRVLRQHRDDIYQYNDNVKLLFHTIDAMIHDSSANYHIYMDRWYDDMKYIHSLLPDQNTLIDETSIRETDDSLGRIEHLYVSMGVLLTVLTMGLYYFWRQRLAVA